MNLLGRKVLIEPWAETKVYDVVDRIRTELDRYGWQTISLITEDGCGHVSLNEVSLPNFKDDFFILHLLSEIARQEVDFRFSITCEV